MSSAAQAPVKSKAIADGIKLDDMDAYAQSKLAITMWTNSLADELGANGPMVVAVNPGSLLASKMVKEGFDNDAKQFAPPHTDALNDDKCQEVLAAIQAVLR